MILFLGGTQLPSPRPTPVAVPRPFLPEILNTPLPLKLKTGLSSLFVYVCLSARDASPPKLLNEFG